MSDDRLNSYLDSLDDGEGYTKEHLFMEACAKTGAGRKFPRGMEAIENTLEPANVANLLVAADYEETVARVDTAIELDAFTHVIAPDVAMWRYFVASAWQDALKHGEIATTPVLGADLRHGDKFAQKYTGFLYRLLEPVKSGVAHDEREYTIWRVVSLNTPRAAMSLETIYDCAEYRVVRG